MGLCESTNRQNHDVMSDSTISYKPNRYPTIVIPGHLRTITEEEQNDELNPSKIDHISKLGSVYQQHGKEVISGQTFILLNPSKTCALYSHKVKHSNGKFNEVTVCDQIASDYGVWMVTAQDNNPIPTSSIILIKHNLTQDYLCSENLDVGCMRLKGQVDESCYWIVEFSNEILEDQNTVRIRPQTQPKHYLTRTNVVGQIDTHRVVSLSAFSNINSLWIVRLISV